MNRDEALRVLDAYSTSDFSPLGPTSKAALARARAALSPCACEGREALAVVEGWTNEADYDPVTGELRDDTYFWLWREMPPELAGVVRPARVIVLEGKP